jgi:cell wall-associated NlpC family hydrolase
VVVFRRLSVIAVVGFAVSSSSATASGPILFTVVPTFADPAVVTPGSAPYALPGSQKELALDRGALARTRREEQLQAVAVARAENASASAVLLSDQLDADKRVFQLELARSTSAAKITQLEQAIPALELALQPTPLASIDPFAGSLATQLGEQAVTIAEQYLGIPYQWGGASPLGGFDCSGLTMFVYGQLGVPLPHYAAAQWNQGPRIDSSQLQPGDLVFFEPRTNGPGHVGIYVGGDQFIEAPHTGDVVKIASISEEAAALEFVGATRPYALSTQMNMLGY